jgi:hypothetical protein
VSEWEAARLGEKSGEIDRLSEELDQANARIRELETQLVDTERRRAAAVDRRTDVQARLEAADRLADAVEVSFRAWGSWFGSPGGSSESVVEASERAADALAAYRAALLDRGGEK